MKRLWAVAVLFLTLPTVAQIRGVPASVTSFGPGRGNTPGVAASVTSLGPNGFSNAPRFTIRPQFNGHHSNNGFTTICSTPGALIPSAMGCTGTSFTNQFYGLPVNATHTNIGHGTRGRAGGYYPVYVPYAVPVVLEGDEPTAQPDTQAIVEDEAEEPPALTMYEHRARLAPSATASSAPAVNESRVYHPAPNQATAPAPEERIAPSIVLIYKDGHQREVQNYAIMGNYIYDIGGFSAQKIPLTDLNLKATLKANDERGTDFSLPAGLTP